MFKSIYENGFQGQRSKSKMTTDDSGKFVTDVSLTELLLNLAMCHTHKAVIESTLQNTEVAATSLISRFHRAFISVPCD